MKSNLLLPLLSAVLAFPALAADPTPTPVPGSGGGCACAHPRLHERILEKFDTNKNGVLDPDEKAAAQAARQQRIEKLKEKADTNGDGTVDDAERAAVRAKVRAHRLHGGDHGPAAAATTPAT